MCNAFVMIIIEELIGIFMHDSTILLEKCKKNPCTNIVISSWLITSFFFFFVFNILLYGFEIQYHCFFCVYVWGVTLPASKLYMLCQTACNFQIKYNLPHLNLHCVINCNHIRVRCNVYKREYNV